MIRQKTILLMSLSAMALALLAGCNNNRDANTQNGTSTAAAQSAIAKSYICPMHPHYISTDEDGSCPICRMDLVPVASAQAPTGKGEILYYKNPMGQQDTSPVPKKDSMGMDYIAVYANEVPGGVAVSPEMIQTMGIKTAPARLSRFGGNIRVYGQIEANPRLETVSASRLEGWIENLTVRAIGDAVKRGGLLYRIYSPDLIGAQKEYLAALTIGNATRIAAVRQRLKSKGLQESSIVRLTQTQELIERIPVYAESAGIVSMLHVREGDYIKPGASVMRLQSYDIVWVIAAVPETDLRNVSTGMPVKLHFESTSDAPITGIIDYIYPTIDAKTRTADVRVEVKNKSGALRPGAYADIIIERGDMDQARLSVLTQAVLRDSQGAHVVVALGEGRFESRPIEIGEVSSGRTEVIAGLMLGEMIVSSGQFLLDSETNLREGFSKLTSSQAGFDAATPLSELPVDAAVLGRIDHIVDASLYLHEALINGYPIDPSFLDPIIEIADGLEAEFSGSTLTPIVTAAKKAIVSAKDSRSGPALAANLAQLNSALYPWLTWGAPSHYQSKGLVFYSDPGTERRWIQQGGPAANPFGGDDGDE